MEQGAYFVFSESFINFVADSITAPRSTRLNVGLACVETVLVLTFPFSSVGSLSHTVSSQLWRWPYLVNVIIEINAFQQILRGLHQILYFDAAPLRFLTRLLFSDGFYSRIFIYLNVDGSRNGMLDLDALQVEITDVVFFTFNGVNS